MHRGVWLATDTGFTSLNLPRKLEFPDTVTPPPLPDLPTPPIIADHKAWSTHPVKKYQTVRVQLGSDRKPPPLVLARLQFRNARARKILFFATRFSIVAFTRKSSRSYGRQEGFISTRAGYISWRQIVRTEVWTDPIIVASFYIAILQLLGLERYHIIVWLFITQFLDIFINLFNLIVEVGSLMTNHFHNGKYGNGYNPQLLKEFFQLNNFSKAL